MLSTRAGSRAARLLGPAVAGLALLVQACTGSGAHPFPPSSSSASSPPASSSPAPALPPATGLLTQTNLLYGTEIGAWEVNGGPAVQNPAVVGMIRAARTPVIKFSVFDCFTGQRCGANHHEGTQSVAAYQSAIRGITRTDHAIPWLKFLPVARNNINGIIGTVFCPPVNGSDWAMNLPVDKKVLAATAAVYKGPIILEDNNEAEYDCARAWGYSSDGSPGVSADLGRMYAATMPELISYARSLGFSDVVSVGYIGVSGGPGWGNPCSVYPRATFGYSCAIPATYIDEFNNAVHAAYVASHDNPDQIPQVESIHSYCHSADFTRAPGFPVPDKECYAWQRDWIRTARAQVDRIWGDAIGSQIRFSVSEWSGGKYSTPIDSWTGYHNGGMASYVADYYKMLQGDGRDTGSGDAYWSASLFEVASNPQGNGYNLIEPNGAPSGYYAAYKAASRGGQ